MVQAYIRVLETLAARMVQLEAEVSDLRILATVATRCQQGRNILAFFTTTVQAAQTGDSRPSLLPVGV